MLVIKNVSKNFSGLAAVSDVSFAISNGEIVSMIGPNGAGKTSVFNMITGFYKPDAGGIWFEDVNLCGLPPYKIAHSGLARTFQNIEIFRELTVEENMQVACQCRSPVTFAGAVLTTPLKRRREAEETERITELLESFGLAAKHGILSSELSYGEQRWLEIARALATGASFLLLDEPTAGMTPTEVGSMMKTIQGLKQRGITIFIIEHNMNMVMGISDRIIVLDHGVKIAEGSPSDIQANQLVRKAYLGDGRADNAAD